MEMFNALFKFSLRALAYSLTAFCVSIVGLLYLPPLPSVSHMKFEPYDVPMVMDLRGPLALNTKLNKAEKLFDHLIVGPESIVHAGDGILYTGVKGGWLLKIVNETIVPIVNFGRYCDDETFREHCTRPLGLFMDSSKKLYICDAYNGLFKVNIETGVVEQLVSASTPIEGRRSEFFNSVTVTSDGKIYYTIMDSYFDLKNIMFSLLGDGTGRLVRYDPKTKTNTVLLDGLHMANGVAMAPDETYLVVAQTKKNMLTRYFLRGTKAGTSETFVDKLPGMPDNVKVDKHGNFYVSLVLTKNSNLLSTYLDVLGSYPMLRKVIVQLLAMLRMAYEYAYSIYPHIVLRKGSMLIGQYETYADFMPQERRATVVKIDKDGKIIDSLHATDGSVGAISDIEFVGDYAYLGSPYNKYLARVKLSGGH